MCGQIGKERTSPRALPKLLYMLKITLLLVLKEIKAFLIGQALFQKTKMPVKGRLFQRAT